MHRNYKIINLSEQEIQSQRFQYQLKNNLPNFPFLHLFLYLIIFIDQKMYETTDNSTLVERLLKNMQKKQVFEAITKVSQQQTNQITNKVLQQIDNGMISLSVPQSNCNNYINHKIKEEALKNIYESEEYYNYERDINIMKGITAPLQIPPPIREPRKKRKRIIREQQIVMQKKSAEQIKRQFLQKVKAWEQQRSLIQKRKHDIQTKKQSLQISSQEKRKKQKQQVKAFLKLEKKKIIERKLKEIQQRKYQRQQILQLSSVKKSESLPKYIQVQKNHKHLQKQKQIQNQILLKNRKQQLQLKMQQIKQHEKAYIQRIKDRLQIQSLNKSIKKQKNSISKSVQSFNINKKDPVQLKKIEEKIKRIKKIQSKIRLMPLKIDEEKRKQMQIMGDKLKNKKKYNFLSQKALSDELIYQQFKDFDINIDKKQLGNQYFQEFKSQPKLTKRKVSSQKVLPTNQPQYKNYLHQFRQNKNAVLNPNEFDSLAIKMNKMKDKSAGKKYLLQKSQHFQQKALQKIHELKKMHSYHDSVRKQQQIDKNYMKAIQAKLALAKVQ